jgi:hypothetical protein
MSFYYDPGNQPDDDEDQGSLREALAITFVVFKVLAIPVAIMFGAVASLILLFVLFSTHVLLGVGALGLIAVAIGVRAIWEWKHPPTFE